MPGAPAIVWHSSAIPASFASLPTLTASITLTQAVPAGSTVLVLAVADINNGGTYSVSDSAGQVYTNYNAFNVIDATGITLAPTPGTHLLWYKTNHPGLPVGSGISVSSNVGFAALHVYVLRGVDAVTPISTAAKQRWQNTAIQAGQSSGPTGSVTKPNVLLLGGMHSNPDQAGAVTLNYSAGEIAAPYTLAEIAQWSAYDPATNLTLGTREVSGFRALTAASGSQSFNISATATNQLTSFQDNYNEIFCIVVNGETNVAPNAPTVNTHANFDATQDATFTWVFSDPNVIDGQTAYELIVQTNPGGVTAYDSGKITSTSSSHTIPGGTLTPNLNYQFKVRTYDQSDAVSAYSSLSSFSTAPPPTVVITFPVFDGATVFITTPAVSWTFTGYGGIPQINYELVIQHGATIDYDSGVVSGAATSQVVSPLLSGVTYTATLTATDSNGNSSIVNRTFIVSAPSPTPPLVTAAPSPDGGAVRLTITSRS